MSILVFDATPDGFKEAERLAQQFEREGRGRVELTRRSAPLVDRSGKRNLFGYLATQQDVDEFNRCCKGKAALKVEVKRRREMVEEPMRRMREQAAQAGMYKSQVVEKSHKLLEEQIALPQLLDHLDEGRASRQQLDCHEPLWPSRFPAALSLSLSPFQMSHKLVEVKIEKSQLQEHLEEECRQQMSHKLVEVKIEKSQLQEHLEEEKERRQQLACELEGEKQQRQHLESTVLNAARLMQMKEEEVQAVVARHKKLAAQHKEEVSLGRRGLAAGLVWQWQGEDAAAAGEDLHLQMKEASSGGGAEQAPGRTAQGGGEFGSRRLRAWRRGRRTWSALSCPRTHLSYLHSSFHPPRPPSPPPGGELGVDICAERGAVASLEEAYARSLEERERSRRAVEEREADLEWRGKVANEQHVAAARTLQRQLSSSSELSTALRGSLHAAAVFQAGLAQLKQQQHERLLQFRQGVKKAKLELLQQLEEERVRFVEECEALREESEATLDQIECRGVGKTRRMGGAGQEGSGSEVGGEWSGSEAGRGEEGSEVGRGIVGSVVDGGEGAGSVEGGGVVGGEKGGEEEEGVQESEEQGEKEWSGDVAGEEEEKEVVCGKGEEGGEEEGAEKRGKVEEEVAVEGGNEGVEESEEWGREEEEKQVEEEDKWVEERGKGGVEEGRTEGEEEEAKGPEKVGEMGAMAREEEMVEEGGEGGDVEGEAEREAEGESEGKAEGEAKGEAEGEAEREAEGEAEGGAEGEAEGEASSEERNGASEGVNAEGGEGTVEEVTEEGSEEAVEKVNEGEDGLAEKLAEEREERVAEGLNEEGGNGVIDKASKSTETVEVDRLEGEVQKGEVQEGEVQEGGVQKTGDGGHGSGVNGGCDGEGKGEVSQVSEAAAHMSENEMDEGQQQRDGDGKSSMKSTKESAIGDEAAELPATPVFQSSGAEENDVYGPESFFLH
ncbi:unnamed protein product [Closterium sp. NIES-53]